MKIRHILLILLLYYFSAVSSAHAITLTDHSPFPKDISIPGALQQPEANSVSSVILEDITSSSTQEIIFFAVASGAGFPPSALKMFETEGSESTGSFGNVPASALSPAVADLDNNLGNGREIVFTVGSTLQVYYSNFTPWWSYSLGSQGTSPSIADIDRDGNLEVLVGDSSGKVYALSNTGVLRWGSPTSLSCNIWVNSPLAISDFNYGDNSLEIIALCTNGNIKVINNAGNVIRTISTGEALSALPYSAPVIGDVNNDGELEIVLATQYKVHVFYKNGTYLPGWPVNLDVGDGGRTSLGDLDGDGKAEIVVIPFNSLGTRGIRVYYSNGTQAWQISDFNTRSQAIIADVDSDSLPEVIINTNSNTIAVLKNGAVNYSKSLSGEALDASPAVGDADGDSNLEIALAREGAGGAAKVYLFDADAAFNPAASPWRMFQGDAMHTGMLSPVAKITSPENNSIFNTRNINFSGYALSSIGGISYEWSSDINGTLGTNTSFTASGLKAGIHKITFRATEQSTGRVDEDIVYINVINAPPQASITSPANGSVYNIGEVISFNATASDSDGYIAKYEWDFDGDGSYEYSNATTGNKTESYSSAGNKIASLRVTDNDGGSTIKQVNIRINAPPTAVITSPAGSLYKLGDSIIFSCNCTDSDGSITTYNWSSSIDGSLSSSSSFTINTLTNGTHLITLKITDNNNANATANKTVKINIPPTANVTSPLNNSIFQEGETVIFSGTASDPDGSISSYEWFSNIDFVLSNSQSFITSNLSIGMHKITFTATDNDGHTGTSEITIKINSPPSVTIDSPLNGSASNKANTSVPFTVSASDSDGSIAKYEWDFDGDGSYDYTSAVTGNTTHIFAVSKTYTARFRATDNDNGSKTIEVTFDITEPNAPDAIILSPAFSSSFALLSPVNFSGTGIPVVGNISKYEWDFNGDGAYDYNSTTTGNTTYSFTIPGEYQPKFRVTDTNGKFSINVTRINIINSPPTARIILPPDNGVFYVNETINFKGEGNDSDGSIARYDWYANGALISTSAEFNYSFSTADYYTINLTVKDNFNATGSVKIEIEVANPPGSPGGPGGGGGGGGGIPDVLYLGRWWEICFGDCLIIYGKNAAKEDVDVANRLLAELNKQLISHGSGLVRDRVYRGWIKVYNESELSENYLRTNHLILIGGDYANSLTQKVVNSSNKFVNLGGKRWAIRMSGGEQIAKEDAASLEFSPSPFSPYRKVLIVAGVTRKGTIRGWDYLFSGAGEQTKVVLG